MKDSTSDAQNQIKSVEVVTDDKNGDLVKAVKLMNKQGIALGSYDPFVQLALSLSSLST